MCPTLCLPRLAIALARNLPTGERTWKTSTHCCVLLYAPASRRRTLTPQVSSKTYVVESTGRMVAWLSRGSLAPRPPINRTSRMLLFKTARFNVTTARRGGPYPPFLRFALVFPVVFSSKSRPAESLAIRVVPPAFFRAVTRKVPCRPFVHVIDSHRSRKHSSVRRPVSREQLLQILQVWVLTKYLASSCGLITLSGVPLHRHAF